MGAALVHAKWIVTGVQDRHTPIVHKDAGLVHENGKVVAVGPFAEISAQYPDAPVTHFRRHVLLPGFVNSHHHVGLTPLQLGSPDHALELWFATRMSARTVDIYLDTLYSAFEMIASGTTTVQHLQGWAHCGVWNMDHAIVRTLNAYQTIGMRASHGYCMREQNSLVYQDDVQFCASLPSEVGEPLRRHLQAGAMGMDEQLGVYRRLRDANADNTRVRLQLAPANLHWVSDEGIMKMVEQAKVDNVPMHMHLLETAYQKEYARRRTGTTAVRHLHNLGALGSWMTLGHAVWLNQEDLELVAHHKGCICHNCSSNFRLRSGLAPVNVIEKLGIPMGLGLDEAGINEDRDMLQEMKLVLRAHRTPGIDDQDVPTATQVLRMATEDGAKTTAFRGEIGRLDAGMWFDAVAIDYEGAIYPYQDEDIPLVDVLVQRAHQRHVDTVFVGGDDIYVQGKFKYVDRDAVLAEIAEQLSHPRTSSEEARRQLSKAVVPHVKKFYDGYIKPDTLDQPFYGGSSRI